MIYIAIGLIFIWCVIYPVTDFWVRFLNPSVIRRGKSAGKKICLTFDDGPNPQITPLVLELLRKYQIPAVFFLVGAKAEQSPDLVRRIAAEGHEVGVHTFFHQHAYLMFVKKSLTTVKQGVRALESITGRGAIWFRPPWGALNLFQYLCLSALGLRIVLWAANAGDWDHRTGPAEIVDRLRWKVKPNSVIVLHDAGGDPGAPENTLKALPEVIRVFQAEGYQFVSLQEISGG